MVQTTRTPEKQIAFLAALAETGNITRSAEAIGSGRQTVYDWRERDPEFAEAWDRAVKIAGYGLEDEARRRAEEGVEKPVFHKGEVCGTVREYSDTLLIFLLKAHNPEKYRENTRMELTGANGGPVQLADADRRARVTGLAALAEARRRAQGEPGEDDASDLV